MVRDQAFDVVLCDQNPPDGDGRSLLDELALLRPRAHAVLMTGAYVEPRRWPVLRKPFTSAQLTAHLRSKGSA